MTEIKRLVNKFGSLWVECSLEPWDELVARYADGESVQIIEVTVTRRTIVVRGEVHEQHDL